MTAWTGFDEEQRSMRQVLREALEDADAKADDTVAEVPWSLGIAGLLLAEEDGGLELGPVELLLVCEELGAHLADAPYLASSVLGAALLRDLPGAAAATLRAEVADGATRLAVADLTAAGPAYDGATVSGELDWVLGDQGHLLARTDAGLVRVTLDQPGVTLSRLETLDQHRVVARMRLDHADADLLAGPDLVDGAVADALAVAELAVAGIAVGGARWALEAAVSYAATRTQFGQPIGSFQAVKHLCAEMLVSLEAAKALALNAALLMADEARPGTWRRDLDAAFLCATEEFVAVAKSSTHVHGGVGVTWEFGLHRYLKRALSLDSLVEPVGVVRDRLRVGLRASQA